MHDLVIVGAGPAGVATAYYLRDLGLDVVVIEAEAHIGGRTLAVDVGGVRANTGALFVYRGTPAEDLVEELGIATTPFTPTTYGIHVAGQTVVDSDNGRLIERLPISETARAQLSSFVAESLREYSALTRGGVLSTEAGRLAGERIGDRLRGLEPETVEIISRAVQGGSVADPSDLSAQYALRYFASYLAHETDNRLYPTVGMDSIVRGMADRLPAGTIRLDTSVTNVSQCEDSSEGGSYNVEIAGQEALSAREVLFAVPAATTLSLTGELPNWKRAALSTVKTPGATTLSVTADITGLDEIADWAFIAVTGRVFDAMINPAPGGIRADGAGRRVAQFVCYGNSAGYRPDLAEDPAGTDEWVEEFLEVAPQLRGRILGAHLQTWQHCFAILTPERIDALPELQASVEGLHFAGDHTSATAGTHGAYTEARRVADLIRSTRR